ncbi:MAG: DUF3348 domain-containing protein [Pseudomonadales bacterium]|nr:DUF3348 domain-containing protein [Pseudomonadales bacterium]
MSQAFSNVSLYGSRLIRALTDLAVADVDLSHDHFTDRLAGLVDISGSITLSDAHSQSRRLEFVAESVSSETLQMSFAEVRTNLVKGILQSFVPGQRGMRIKLPKEERTEEAEPLGFEPYHRFYAAHQRDMEAKVRRLHDQIRDQVAVISPELAKITILDRAFSDILQSYARKSLAVTPRLLGTRFRFLQRENKVRAEAREQSASKLWLTEDTGLIAFCHEMKTVLLAELEVRLLPVMALIEAANAAQPQ